MGLKKKSSSHKKRTKKGGYEQVAHDGGGEVEMREMEKEFSVPIDDEESQKASHSEKTIDQVIEEEGGSGELGASDVIVSVYCVTGAASIGRQLASTLVPVLGMRSLGLNSREIGIATACVGIGRILGNAPGACLGRYIGDSATAALGLCTMIAAGAGLALSGSLRALCLAQAGIGLHLSIFELGRQSYLRVNVADQVRGTVLSLVGTSKRLASIVGPAIGGAAAHAKSPRSAIALFVPACGVLSLLLHVCFLPNMSENPRQSRQDTQNRHSLCASYAIVLREHLRPLLSTALFGLAMFWLRTARELLLPLRALHLDIDTQTLGGVIALGYISDSALALTVSGRIMDRHGRKPAGLMACIGLSLGFIATAMSRDKIDLAIASLLLGAGNGLSSGLLMTVSTDLAPREHRATFLSLFRFFTDCGVLLGAYSAGEAAAMHNTAIACALNAAFALFTALVVVFGLPETRPSRESQRNGVTAARLGDTTRADDFSFRDDPELMASTAANPLRSSSSHSSRSSSGPQSTSTLFGTAAAVLSQKASKQPATYSIIDPDADDDDHEPIFGGNNSMLSTTTEINLDTEALDHFFADDEDDDAPPLFQHQQSNKSTDEMLPGVSTTPQEETEIDDDDAFAL